MISEQLSFDFGDLADTDRHVVVRPPSADDDTETIYYLNAFKGKKGTVEKALNDGHGSVIVRFSETETGFFHEDELKVVD